MYVMPGNHEPVTCSLLLLPVGREATSLLPVFLLPAGQQLLHLLQLCLERLGLAAHDVELAL